jgi:hypothetical protein
MKGPRATGPSTSRARPATAIAECSMADWSILVQKRWKRRLSPLSVEFLQESQDNI